MSKELLPEINNTNKGSLSEGLAARFLIEKGFGEIARNFNAKCGEIDLIFFDRANRNLVFVEVRSTFGKNDLLKYSIGRAKRLRLKKTIFYFLNSKQALAYVNVPFRVDVIWVNHQVFYPQCIEHWKNVDIS